jgi:hypothetical protein
MRLEPLADAKKLTILSGAVSNGDGKAPTDPDDDALDFL